MKTENSKRDELDPKLQIDGENALQEQSEATSLEGKRQLRTKTSVIKKENAVDIAACGDASEGVIKTTEDAYFVTLTNKSQPIEVPATSATKKQFQCRLCKLVFSKRWNCLSHMRAHNRVRPTFLCTWCGKRCSKPSELAIHTRIHTGTKPFACLHCPRRFVRQGQLNSHMRTHTGVKPHLCHECGAFFASVSNLKRHQRAHAKAATFRTGCTKRRTSARETLDLKKRGRGGKAGRTVLEAEGDPREENDRSEFNREEKGNSDREACCVSVLELRAPSSSAVQCASVKTEEALHTPQTPNITLDRKELQATNTNLIVNEALGEISRQISHNPTKSKMTEVVCADEKVTLTDGNGNQGNTVTLTIGKHEDNGSTDCQQSDAGGVREGVDPTPVDNCQVPVVLPEPLPVISFQPGDGNETNRLTVPEAGGRVSAIGDAPAEPVSNVIQVDWSFLLQDSGIQTQLSDQVQAVSDVSLVEDASTSAVGSELFHLTSSGALVPASDPHVAGSEVVLHPDALQLSGLVSMASVPMVNSSEFAAVDASGRSIGIPIPHVTTIDLNNIQMQQDLAAEVKTEEGHVTVSTSSGPITVVLEQVCSDMYQMVHKLPGASPSPAAHSVLGSGGHALTTAAPTVTLLPLPPDATDVPVVNTSNIPTVNDTANPSTGTNSSAAVLTPNTAVLTNTHASPSMLNNITAYFPNTHSANIATSNSAITAHIPNTNSANIATSNSTTVPNAITAYIPHTNSANIATSNTTTIPNAITTYIPHTNSANIATSNSTTIPNAIGAYHQTAKTTNIPNTLTAQIPATSYLCSTNILNTVRAYFPNAEVTNVLTLDNTNIPNSVTAYIPNPNTTSISTLNGTNIPNTITAYIPNVDATNILTQNGTHIPNTITAYIPNAGTTNIGNRNIPNVITAVIPNSSSVTNISTFDAASVPNTFTPNIPNAAFIPNAETTTPTPPSNSTNIHTDPTNASTAQSSPTQSVVDDSAVKPEKQPSPEQHKPFVCDVCPKRFSRKWYLTVHRNAHFRQKSYACPECGATFSRVGNLNRHRQTHSGARPFHCLRCQAKFASKYRLVEHERRHDGLKPYKCDECRSCFSDCSSLRRHQQAHKGNNLEHTCEVCGAQFRTPHSLTFHLKLHASDDGCPEMGIERDQDDPAGNVAIMPLDQEQVDEMGGMAPCVLTSRDPQGQRRFLCSVCRKPFLHSAACKQHVLCHTGARPFRCTDCGTRFSRRTDAKRHMRTHRREKRHQCGQCGEKFQTKSRLILHEEEEHGGAVAAAVTPAITCRECGKTFSTEGVLKIHKQIFHRRHLCAYWESLSGPVGSGDDDSGGGGGSETVDRLQRGVAGENEENALDQKWKTQTEGGTVTSEGSKPGDGGAQQGMDVGVEKPELIGGPVSLPLQVQVAQTCGGGREGSPGGTASAAAVRPPSTARDASIPQRAAARRQRHLLATLTSRRKATTNTGKA